jgi:hypothetical protein
MHATLHRPHFVRPVRHIAAVDVVVEGGAAGEPSRGLRLLHAGHRSCEGGRAGCDDIVSGFVAFRLITLRNALRDAPDPMLRTEGWAANAELIGRAARHARRIETVPTVERHDLRHRPSRLNPWDTARALWRSRGSLHFTPPVERRRLRGQRSSWFLMQPPGCRRQSGAVLAAHVPQARQRVIAKSVWPILTRKRRLTRHRGGGGREMPVAGRPIPSSRRQPPWWRMASPIHNPRLAGVETGGLSAVTATEVNVRASPGRPSTIAGFPRTRRRYGSAAG